MKLIVKLMIVGSIFVNLAFSCEKITEKNLKLFGTWKFVGFGDSNRSIIKLQIDCEKCYILTFKKDGTLIGRSSANELAAKFNLSGNNLSFFYGIRGTEIGEPLIFTNALREVNSYKIENNQLKLFYKEGKFLLFNSIINKL